MRFIATVLTMVALSFQVASTFGAPPDANISVLIIDGMNNHNWQRGTILLKAILENSERFMVDVSTTRTNTAPEWIEWHPHFANYQVIVNPLPKGFPTELEIRVRDILLK